MAFQEVGNNNFKYGVKYAECQEGDVLAEGIYLGHRIDQFGKPAHMIKQDDGVVQVLNSSGSLNWKFENLATVGDYVRVTYDGVIRLEKGKYKNKDSHQFKLEIDPDRRQDGIKAPSPSAEEAYEDEDGEEAEEDAAEEAEVTKYKRTATPAAAPAKKAPTRAPAPAAEETEEEETAEEDEAPAPAAKRTSNQEVLNKYRRKA